MILLPATFDGFRSLKDRSVNITFNTQELTPDNFTEIGQAVNSFGFLAYKVEPFAKTEVTMIEALKTDFEDTGKTPGERLRNVHYRLWEQDAEGYKTFHDYYQAKMEIIINHLKGRLL